MTSHFLKSSTVIFSAKNICKALSHRCITIASNMATPSTIDAKEMQKFDSDEWWFGEGYSLLRSFNSMRVPLIRDGLLSVSKCYQKVPRPLSDYTILDVGCGGGLLTEPLARLGAKVTGLDPGAQTIQAATEHASKDPEIKENICYVCDTVENLAASGIKYNAVVASEVVEHVNDLQTFIHKCVELTENGGSLFFTTFNRTNLSYFLSILMAEYVLGLIPKGTHEWNKFVKPEELNQILESLNCNVVSIEGMMYNPITKRFSWCRSSANWYALHAVKS